MNARRLPARIWHGVIAVLVLAAVAMQIWVAIRIPSTPSGSHGIGQLRGTSLPDRVLRVASFFTVQSNILCGVVSIQLARNPARDGAVWRVIRLDALFGITVTGIVYSTVLAAIHQPNGAQETFINTVFHYVVPVLMVLGWLLFGPRPRITAKTMGWSLVWPIAWFGYTLAHGEIGNWYPYPFVDVATHGYGRVLLNALVVTAVLGFVALIFAAGDRFLPAAPGGSDQARSDQARSDQARSDQARSDQADADRAAAAARSAQTGRLP